MPAPIQAHFSESWWNDSGPVDDHRPGGLELWALIVLLSLSPGLGVLLTLLLD